jgi:hypothetical protein
LQIWDGNGNGIAPREDLASLAKEKGFITQYFAYVSESFPELVWLFWLTECQKWLRDMHKIWIVVDYQGADFCWSKLVRKSTESWYDVEESYEKALQEGIEQALKLINN